MEAGNQEGGAMKFRVTMKTPDAVDNATNDVLDAEGLPPDDETYRERKDELSTIAETWFQFGEFLTVEIDTEVRTCVVIPVGN
jgi:hypothetical protein